MDLIREEEGDISDSAGATYDNAQFFHSIKLKTMKLKFGKFKGRDFSDTPIWYQEWLNKQPWFTNAEPGALLEAQKQFSQASKRLGNWDGYSRRGEAAYDAMFEAEKAIDDAIFNDPDPTSPYWNGELNYEYESI